MGELKLWRVEVETEIYCVAETAHEAQAAARDHYSSEEPELSAYEAAYVEGEWFDSLPYHRRPELPDKTCGEWLKELNEAG